ncbi:hypothetical protein HID58_069657 [Brassica napus]|uniref:Uncharacterized protein n=1 Tax=Brassica napus TaxID=3708 RepID=A0ABQ7YWM1_BRANA|nr:hypothetical protein HID58_069657 [Brassica napus]
MEDKPVDDNHVGADHGVQVEEISENVVEGEVNVTGNSSVGALLAELEALPVSKLANGVVAYQLANAVEVIELEAGKMNEGGENQGCKEIPSRNLPSLDDPEVEKTSFDVASASDTVSPSLFKVLETLNEENELLVDGEFLVEDEDTMVDESAKEGHDRVLATKKHVKTSKSGTKAYRKPIRTTRDLKLQNMQGPLKNSSSRKI